MAQEMVLHVMLVIAPLWQQPGAIVVASLLALAVISAVAWARVRHYKTRYEQLAAQAAGRTGEDLHQASLLEQAQREKRELETQLLEQAAAFERMSREDDLSGLPNRRAFDDEMIRSMARSRRGGHPLSLLVLEVDGLSEINEAWSHSVGDLVLCDVGEVLRVTLRASDIPGRLDGAVFAVLLADTGLSDAELACTRLYAKFRDYVGWGGREDGSIAVTFSGGVVQMDERDLTPSQLRLRADHALEQAKQQGGAVTCSGL